MRASFFPDKINGLVAATTIALCLLSSPYAAHALGSAADAMCNPFFVQCQCDQIPNPQQPGSCMPGGPKSNTNGCPVGVCKDLTNGYTSNGICIMQNKCQGQNSGGQNGSSMSLSDLSKLMQQIQGILKGMGGGGGGGSGGGSGGGTGGGGIGGDGSLLGSGLNTNPQVGQCPSYYTVTIPSSDPCAVYNPSGSATFPASDLLNSLASNSTVDNNTPLDNSVSQTGSSDLLNTTGTTPPLSQDTSGAATGGTDTTAAAPFASGPLALPPGVSGDIRFSDTRVSVLVSNIDAKNGTQVSGFYGVSTNGQPQEVIKAMCATRPWKSNFLSFIVPPAFFDSLCTLRGFKVGEPAPVTATHVASPTPKPAPKPTPVPPLATSTEPYVPPKADIWAVPTAVSLGARTTVFWSAKGVTSCTETSPDGSFSQNTLSGGAATVPLSGATTYTISCLTPSGDHITNFVTVNLSTN